MTARRVGADHGRAAQMGPVQGKGPGVRQKDCARRLPLRAANDPLLRAALGPGNLVGIIVEGTEAVEDRQESEYRSIEQRRVDSSGPDRLSQSWPEGPAGTGHLEVETCGDGPAGVCEGVPVGHDDALESPFVRGGSPPTTNDCRRSSRR